MTRPLVVVRPEPGATRTLTALAAAGLDARACPFFAVAPVAWAPPPPGDFDALLLTSAQALRHAGPALATLAALPVVAVGPATAAAARDAGLCVAVTGAADAAAAIAAARVRGLARLLHLAGRDRIDGGDAVVAITVYAAEPVPLPPGTVRDFEDMDVLLHSARAARRLAALVDREGADRGRIGLVALSPAIRDAAGPGWRYALAAPRPDDAALVALALQRLHD